MKKTLLMTFVAFATISAYAQVSAKKSPFQESQKVNILKQRSPFAGMDAKITAYQAPMAHTTKKNIKSIKKADENIKLTADYSEQTWRYSSVYYGGFMVQNMYDGASHKVNGKKAYLKPYDDIEGIIEGTVEEGTNIMSEEYGADSITFRCDEPIAFYTNEKNENVNIYLRPSEYGINEDYTGYNIYPNGSNTFGAYYVAKDDILYIPDNIALALYAENETTPIDDAYTLVNLNLIPQATYELGMKKATISAKCMNGSDYDFERDSKVLIGEDYILVKGVSGINPDAWIEFDMDEEDASLLYVNENAYLCTKNFTTNDKTTTYVFSTVGMKNNGLDWGFNEETYDEEYYYPSYYSLTSNDDGSYTLKSANNTAFGEYYYTNQKDGDDVYNWYDLTINIYDEVPTSIASVKNSTDNIMYNLAGQRIEKLQRGINIVNGKKVVIK